MTGHTKANSNPRTQLQCANCQVTQRPRRSNQFDPAVQKAIQDLCTLREQEEEDEDSDSDGGEEESDESEEIGEDVELSSEESDGSEENNVTELEALINYALTLSVEGTVNLRISRTGEGMIEIKK